jgi:L-threonylcarbamoyladenylate synthase
MIVPDIETIRQAGESLRAGQLVAFPTETVYGLGADATNADAVLSIYETKGRPRFNPLIVHCADLDMAKRFGVFGPIAEQLAKAFWPGPLTIVVPLAEGHCLADVTTAGLNTVGIRVPNHPIATALIRAADRPLAAPSANPSGKLSPTSALQVEEGFDGRVAVLDGGSCTSGVESTIVTVEGETIIQLRAGALARDDIETVTGKTVVLAEKGAKISAPGMLLSHYAPNAAIRLGAIPQVGEAYLAFGAAVSHNGPTLNLSPNGDLREAARNLFAFLHQLDKSGAGMIAVAPIPSHGLGEAINDRLSRAAAPRG